MKKCPDCNGTGISEASVKRGYKECIWCNGERMVEVKHREIHYPFVGSNIPRFIARNPYAWPGGYNIAGITSDGALLCSKCIREEYRNVMNSSYTECSDGWWVTGWAVMDVDGPDYCDNCNEQLASYYDEEE